MEHATAAALIRLLFYSWAGRRRRGNSNSNWNSLRSITRRLFFSAGGELEFELQLEFVADCLRINSG